MQRATNITIAPGTTVVAIPAPAEGEMIRVVSGLLNWRRATPAVATLRARSTGGQVLTELVRVGLDDVQVLPVNPHGWLPDTLPGEGLTLTWINPLGGGAFMADLCYVVFSAAAGGDDD